MIGKSLAHYQITSQTGRGGIGGVHPLNLEGINKFSKRFELKGIL